MFKTKTISIDLIFLVWVIWILVIRICLVLRAQDFEFDIEPASCSIPAKALAKAATCSLVALYRALW